MKIISWNSRFASNVEERKLINLIITESPDILCLQVKAENIK